MIRYCERSGGGWFRRIPEGCDGEGVSLMFFFVYYYGIDVERSDLEITAINKTLPACDRIVFGYFLFETAVVHVIRACISDHYIICLGFMLNFTSGTKLPL